MGPAGRLAGRGGVGMGGLSQSRGGAKVARWGPRGVWRVAAAVRAPAAVFLEVVSRGAPPGPTRALPLLAKTAASDFGHLQIFFSGGREGRGGARRWGGRFAMGPAGRLASRGGVGVGGLSPSRGGAKVARWSRRGVWRVSRRVLVERLVASAHAEGRSRSRARGRLGPRTGPGRGSAPGRRGRTARRHPSRRRQTRSAWRRGPSACTRTPRHRLSRNHRGRGRRT